MMIKPVGKRVVLKNKENEKRTNSGLYLIDSSANLLIALEVLAIGNEINDIKVGQQVIVDKAKGVNFKYNNNDYLIFEYDDILGVVEHNE